jgi:hypothetical protein
MKIISYSLFGYGSQFENCFSFNSYLRALLLSIRMNRLIYPEFINRVHTDQKTYDGCPILGKLERAKIIQCHIIAEAPLCKAMLWRLLPAFDCDVELFLCRDLDSLTSYKERQLVEYWMHGTKMCHAITDSVSHNIPLMGGMVAFRSKEFREYTACATWDQMFNKFGAFNFTNKGSDQDWLNAFIYPLVSQHGRDSIVQHYLKGMPNTYLSAYFNEVPDITVPIAHELRSSNDCTGHIGAAGWYETVTMKFFAQHRDRFDDIKAIEAQYADIFYWTKENTI